MNVRQITKLNQKKESDTVEFKKSLSEWKEIVETVSALSNTSGGIIFVGISDEGNIIGVNIGQRTIEDLADKIKQNTDPKIYPSISVLDLADKSLIEIKVAESPSKPIFAFDKVFKRVGKSNHKVSSEEIRKMALEGKRIYWDEQICEGANLKDIDWNFVKNNFVSRYEVLSERKIVGRSEHLLETLGCIRNDRPTNGGIMLFGKNPQKFFPNTFIAAARYKGINVGTERLDYKEFDGNLFQQIDNCDKYIKEHIAVMSRLLPDRVKRQDIPEYGWFSIRELITNAVCHRDYFERGSKVIIKMFDNKIEFYNPGGLPEEITPKNITKKQFSRNPVIARVLAKAGYIEELGEGWDKLIEEHKNHPLKPRMPSIDADIHSVLVTIFSIKDKFKDAEATKLNERQKRAIEYLRKNMFITTNIFAELVGVSERQARYDLGDLVKKKIIIAEGATTVRRYCLRQTSANFGKNDESAQ
jgi:ATP-dependent DNA helicase RecG